MKVRIEIIPHQEQRYQTVGDWVFDSDGNLIISVSKMSDWRLEMLVAIHELVEVVLCKHDGVTQESVDKFDIEYEANRPEGDISDPGDDDNAPYNLQHCIATGVERIVAANLGVGWKKYDAEVMSL